MALPTLMVIKSNYNGKYLRHINEAGEVHGLQRFSGEEVTSPLGKYQVEPAKCGNGLVNIRCCYNNKYWVRWSENHWWIAAAAEEPEEDQSKWSCTLFEPIFTDATKKVLRLRHVQLGHYACLWRASPPYDSCLFAGSAEQDKDHCDVYTIIDWESLLILPKHVAFKGVNGSYLHVISFQGHPYLQFGSNNIEDPAVANEVFTAPDGSVRFKSEYNAKFWTRSFGDWILADSDGDDSNNKDTLFWPVKVEHEVEDNIIALRNLGNNNYAKRFTVGNNMISFFSANISTNTIESRLRVEELVVSRSVYNVNFRLTDARIYNQSVITLAVGDATNKAQSPVTADVKLSYTESRSSTWNNSVSLRLGVKGRIQTGVPQIVKGKVELSNEFEWGETQTSTTMVEKVYAVVVPPMTTVKVSLFATRGSCDVPFSYSQRDTLMNGKEITYNMDDGVYTGINCFDLRYEVEQIPI